MACTLKSLLDSVLNAEDDWRLRLVRQWPVIVGDLHRKMRLERVSRDTLIIGVYDSHWMQELFMLSRVIIKTINKKLGADYVAKLRFTVASTKKAAAKKPGQQLAHAQRPHVAMSDTHRKALSAVKDNQLQDVLQKLFQRCDS